RLHEDLQGSQEPAGGFVLRRARQQFRLESEIRKDEAGRAESVYRSRRLQSVCCRPQSRLPERTGTAKEESRLPRRVGHMTGWARICLRSADPRARPANTPKVTKGI